MPPPQGWSRNFEHHSLSPEPGGPSPVIQLLPADLLLNTSPNPVQGEAGGAHPEPTAGWAPREGGVSWVPAL